MRTSSALLATAALLIAASACSQAAGETPNVGDQVIDVQVTPLDGETKKLSDYVEGKVAAFKFGTTWCGWCNKLLGEFDKAIEHYGDKVVFLDIDVREPAAKVKAHKKSEGFKTPTVLDPEGEAAKKYNVRGFPTFFIADHTGKILLRTYYLPFDRFKPTLDKAVKAAEEARK